MCDGEAVGAPKYVLCYLHCSAVAERWIPAAVVTRAARTYTPRMPLTPRSPLARGWGVGVEWSEAEGVWHRCSGRAGEGIGRGGFYI